MDRSTRFSKLWFVYVLVYMVYFTLLEVIPIRNFLGDHVGFMYTGIGVLGTALLFYDFVTRRRMFQVQGADLLVLFFVASLISVLINYQYDLFGNIKALMWMAVQVFLLCAFDCETSKRTHVRRLCILFDLFVLLWFLACVWALWQYIIQFGGYIETERMERMQYLRVGFIEGRLHGMFQDPNYACISSSFAIGFAVFCWKWGNHPKWFRVYYGITIVANVFYIILSGSRMGILAVSITAAFAVAFLAVAVVKRGFVLKAISFVVAGALTVLIVMGGCNVIKIGLSYVPHLVEQVVEIIPGEDLGELIFENEVQNEERVDFTREDVEDSDDISNGRFHIWNDYVKVFLDTPIVGASPRGLLAYAEDHFGDIFIVQRKYANVHNAYLALFVSVGLLGGGIMIAWAVWVVCKILGYLIRRWDQRDEEYYMVFLCALLLLMVAASDFMVQGMFFFNMNTDLLFWLVLGFVLYLVRQGEPERNSKPSFVGRACDSLARKLPFGKKGA